MTPFLLGLAGGSWLTVSALTWIGLALDDYDDGPRGWWRLYLALAAPLLVAWHVAGVVVEMGRERREQAKENLTP